MRKHSKKQSDNKKGKTKQEPDLTKQQPNNNQINPLEDENGNEDESELVIEKGVQGEKLFDDILSDESLNHIFNSKYLDPLPMAFKGIDIHQELVKFKIKIRGAPDEYGRRDTAGISNAFLFHLRSCRPETDQNVKRTTSKNRNPSAKSFGTL